MMKKVIFAGLFLLTAAGCATPPGDNSGAAEEKEYVTGSNIPRRDRSMPSDVKNVDPAAIERMRSMGTANSGPKGN
jgi:hypothetical protein